MLALLFLPVAARPFLRPGPDLDQLPGSPEGSLARNGLLVRVAPRALVVAGRLAVPSAFDGPRWMHLTFRTRKNRNEMNNLIAFLCLTEFSYTKTRAAETPAARGRKGRVFSSRFPNKGILCRALGHCRDGLVARRDSAVDASGPHQAGDRPRPLTGSRLTSFLKSIG